MTREEILKGVINIIGIQNNSDINTEKEYNIKETDNLRDDLGMDSLDEIECVIMIENHFSIRIPDAQVEDNLKTVSNVVDIVEGLLKVKDN